MNPTRDEIIQELTKAFVELFEVNEADVTPEAHLGDDLGLDSIDAIDLIVRLQNFTGKKIQPERFKTIRTVEDTIVAVQELLKES